MTPEQLDEIEARIRENEKKNIFAAPVIMELVTAVRALRAEVEIRVTQVDGYRMMIDGLENAAHEERAAVVAYLRAYDGEPYDFADDIELGEHRREGEP